MTSEFKHKPSPLLSEYKHDVRICEIRSHLIQFLIPDRSLNYTSSVLSQPLVMHAAYIRRGICLIT